MKKTVRKFGAALLAGMMVLGLAGCGGSGSGGTTTQAVQTEAQTETAASQAPESQAPAADNKSGGSLKIATPQMQNTFFMPQSASTGDRFAAQPALEPLGRVDENGNYYPWLAEEFITDPEALTFTIKLRDGVKFHDGSVCDAEVVIWNINKYIENGKASEIGSPAKVEAVDSLTVKLSYDSWANNWDNVIGDIYICSQEAYEKNGEEWCKINAVGTGPFKMVSYVADNSVKYVKNEDYRIAGQPYMDDLEILTITDLNTRVSSLMNKEVDLSMKFENAELINTITAAGFESIGKRTADTADIKHIIWNSKNPDYPMGDLKVRQAIMHCIDWDNVALSLSGGLGEATPLFCTKDSWAYSPDAKFYEFDIELGKQMLAEAGYPDGFSTKILTTSPNVDTATAFQACLSLLNIKAEVEIMDSSALAAIQNADDIEGFIANRGASKMDFTSNYIRLYSSEGIKNHGIMVRPAEFEDPLFAARAAKSVEEKKTNLQKAAKALVEDYVMITPLSVVYYQSFAQPNVNDIGVYQCNLEQWTPEAVYLEK